MSVPFPSLEVCCSRLPSTDGVGGTSGFQPQLLHLRGFCICLSAFFPRWFEPGRILFLHVAGKECCTTAAVVFLAALNRAASSFPESSRKAEPCVVRNLVDALK